MVFLISGLIISYENPEIVGNTKKIYKFYFNKNKQIPIEKKQELISDKTDFVEANSFNLEYKKIATFQDRSAGVDVTKDINKNQNVYKIFMSNGFYESEKKINKINLPSTFYNNVARSGGVKAYFKVENEEFILISNKFFNCYYASIVRISDNSEVLKSECLPDEDNIDFNGLGGGHVDLNDSVLIAIGTPTHDSKEIDQLSQNPNSIFGKVLEFKKKDLIEKKIKDINYQFFSSGHRNPQGMTVLEEKIFAIEHGPYGGDELNFLIRDKNYGWPLYSYGTTYTKDKKYLHKNESPEYKQPLYAFLPSVAPSALARCPKNLQDYYSENLCLMATTLREMSLLIILIDKDTDTVNSIEKIKFNERLRHFGLNASMNLFENSDNSFYVTSDDLNFYEFKFTNFINNNVNN